MIKAKSRNSEIRVNGRDCERTRPARAYPAQIVVWTFFAWLLMGSTGLGGPHPVGLLDLPVQPTAPWQSIPLGNALGQLGASVSDGYVLFGLEQRLVDGKEPTVNLNIKMETTLRVALGEILAQLLLTCNDRRYIVQWRAWQGVRPQSVVVRKTGENWHGWLGVGPNLDRWWNERRSSWAVWRVSG